MFTEQEAKSWVENNREEFIQNLRNCDEVPEIFKTPGNRFEEVWCAGCWLNEQLRKAGATEKQIFDIGIVHGQRSAFGNTYKWAVHYANEFEETKKIKDRPGIVAEEIENKHVQPGNGYVAFAIEDVK